MDHRCNQELFLGLRRQLYDGAKRRDIATPGKPELRRRWEGDRSFRVRCGRRQRVEDMSELWGTRGGRRPRATNETVAGSAADQALERYFRQAGKGANMRQRGRV